ncbi:MAG: helix-turn-helix transcriptional regulator [Alphaproteobacteria bacterium]|nr:helix-turn-helix transcriptional regulator [Alphaproteobacteria bacterium]
MTVYSTSLAGSHERSTAPLHWPSVVKHYRLSAGLNQTELADQLAVTQTMVSRWEAGGADPSRRIQELIFDLYWAVSATVSRDIWFEHVRLNPAAQAIIDENGVIRACSRGFARLARCQREDVEKKPIAETFSGDFLELFNFLKSSGFFEGRISRAESMGTLDVKAGGAEQASFPCHGLHRPAFMPGPEVLWIAFGVEVDEIARQQVVERLGGPAVVNKAI